MSNNSTSGKARGGGLTMKLHAGWARVGATRRGLTDEATCGRGNDLG